MKKIKNITGYAIYEAGERDVKKYGFAAGSFYVYFASDIRDFGLSGSTPEFEDCGSIEEAESCCTGNYAKAREIVEGRTTAASFEEIAEVEAQLDAGTIDEDGEPIDHQGDCDAETTDSQPVKLKEDKIMSFYSSRIKTINESAIMKKYEVNPLRKTHSKIDSVFAAWELTGEYTRLSSSKRLAAARHSGESVLEKMKNTPDLMLEAEEAINFIDEAAICNGFALGVQFALAAMKNDGAIWKLLTQSDAANGKRSQT